MTNANEMQAGLELDAMIAVEVMKWYETFPKGACPHIKHWYATTPCPHNAHDDAWRGCLPPFSTDIAAAWKVLEKLKSVGLQIDVGTHYSGWACGIDNSTTRLWSSAPTAPIAICCAALAAARAKKEK